LIQLRAKHATDRQVLAWAADIRALTRDAGCLFFVNDRFDLALAVGADGVHLGQEDLPPALVPVEVRDRLMIGRSTHTGEQALASCGEPVDYVAFGPVFGTESKQSAYSARGPALLEEVVGFVRPRPVFAIGGVDEARCRESVRVGAAGVAVISAVAAADDPERAVRRLVAALRESGAS
jgi:thiamine-phosphate pyrophosphorylase